MVTAAPPLTDGKGTHRYYYDPDGNILREEAPDGSTTTYEWDEFHHLLARHSLPGGWRNLNTTPHTAS
ncbi:RHS repeat protein [Escherichia coli]|nr:RHS repeat protein [Escherichia coli]